MNKIEINLMPNKPILIVSVIYSMKYRSFILIQRWARLQ